MVYTPPSPCPPAWTGAGSRYPIRPTTSVNLVSLPHTSPGYPIKATSVWHTLGHPWSALTTGPGISPVCQVQSTPGHSEPTLLQLQPHCQGALCTEHPGNYRPMRALALATPPGASCEEYSRTPWLVPSQDNFCVESLRTPWLVPLRRQRNMF